MTNSSFEEFEGEGNDDNPDFYGQHPDIFGPYGWVKKPGATFETYARIDPYIDNFSLEIEGGVPGSPPERQPFEEPDSPFRQWLRDAPTEELNEETVKDILGRCGHVDYLVNNAGRSIRRSVSRAR